MLLYRTIAEVYLLVSIVVAPLLCILGWVLLGKAFSRRLHSYIRWYSPLMIGTSLTTSAVLLEAFVSYYDRRNYGLRAGVYLLTLAGLPFHLVSFVRLWQTISRLPPSPGETPPLTSVEQDETVWPPQPRRQP